MRIGWILAFAFAPTGIKVEGDGKVRTARGRGGRRGVALNIGTATARIFAIQNLTGLLRWYYSETTLSREFGLFMTL